MRINSLWYRDNAQEWEVSEMDFFDLTLLVGASGVGKTQILNAILGLKKIASGESLNGIEWKISFIANKNKYVWKGGFEVVRENSEILEEKIEPKLKYEEIYINDELLSERVNDKVFYKENAMPKLASEKSFISIFKEDEISSVHEGFKNLVFRDYTTKDSLRTSFIFYANLKKLLSKYKSLKSIRNSTLAIYDKLLCLFYNQKDYYQDLVNNYKDVFPQIDDIKIEAKNSITLPTIQFKEKGVNKWIPQQQMSSGMIRTLLHISEMFLLSDGTLVLIDEFENSLGVNCIDVLTEDLIYENNRLQFIATSHHPYIINKIPYEYWKIVTRKGGVIKTHNADEFDLGASSHERFMNLINLPQYKSGIESLA